MRANEVSRQRVCVYTDISEFTSIGREGKISHRIDGLCVLFRVAAFDDSLYIIVNDGELCRVYIAKVTQKLCDIACTWGNLHIVCYYLVNIYK